MSRLVAPVAFVDRRLPPFSVRGRRYVSIGREGLAAVVERRSARASRTDAELRHQHAVVIHIRELCGAVVPVRFGELIEEHALRGFLHQHDADLRRGLDLVRDRVQFTIRVTGLTPPPDAAAARSGRAYLEGKLAASVPALPGKVRRFLKDLAPWIVEARGPVRGGPSVATIYHLVNEDAVDAYRARASGHPSNVVVSGSWPAFAFAPTLER